MWPVNDQGCGDSLVAGLAHGLATGAAEADDSVPALLRSAVALATANLVWLLGLRSIRQLTRCIC